VLSRRDGAACGRDAPLFQNHATPVTRGIRWSPGFSRLFILRCSTHDKANKDRLKAGLQRPTLRFTLMPGAHARPRPGELETPPLPHLHVGVPALAGPFFLRCLTHVYVITDRLKAGLQRPTLRFTLMPGAHARTRHRELETPPLPHLHVGVPALAGPFFLRCSTDVNVITDRLKAGLQRPTLRFTFKPGAHARTRPGELQPPPLPHSLVGVPALAGHSFCAARPTLM
jgi:hypothetical protein